MRKIKMLLLASMFVLGSIFTMSPQPAQAQRAEGTFNIAAQVTIDNARAVAEFAQSCVALQTAGPAIFNFASAQSALIRFLSFAAQGSSETISPGDSQVALFCNSAGSTTTNGMVELTDEGLAALADQEVVDGIRRLVIEGSFLFNPTASGFGDPGFLTALFTLVITQAASGDEEPEPEPEPEPTPTIDEMFKIKPIVSLPDENCPLTITQHLSAAIQAEQVARQHMQDERNRLQAAIDFALDNTGNLNIPSPFRRLDRLHRSVVRNVRDDSTVPDALAEANKHLDCASDLISKDDSLSDTQKANAQADIANAKASDNDSLADVNSIEDVRANGEENANANVGRIDGAISDIDDAIVDKTEAAQEVDGGFTAPNFSGQSLADVIAGAKQQIQDNADANLQAQIDNVTNLVDSTLAGISDPDQRAEVINDILGVNTEECIQGLHDEFRHQVDAVNVKLKQELNQIALDQEEDRRRRAQAERNRRRAERLERRDERTTTRNQNQVTNGYTSSTTAESSQRRMRREQRQLERTVRRRRGSGLGGALINILDRKALLESL